MALRASALSPAMRKQLGVASAKPSKYRAVPTWIEGVRFASKREAKRYQQLQALVQAGEITELDIQPAYPIEAWNPKNGEITVVACYRADFRYYVRRTGQWVIEDVKGGPTTPIFRLKKKLVEAQYGIRIVEVR